jgi:hypothetical protein
VVGQWLKLTRFNLRRFYNLHWSIVVDLVGCGYRSNKAIRKIVTIADCNSAELIR